MLCTAFMIRTSSVIACYSWTSRLVLCQGIHPNFDLSHFMLGLCGELISDSTMLRLGFSAMQFSDRNDVRLGLFTWYPQSLWLHDDGGHPFDWIYTVMFLHAFLSVNPMWNQPRFFHSCKVSCCDMGHCFWDILRWFWFNGYTFRQLLLMLLGMNSALHLGSLCLLWIAWGVQLALIAGTPQPHGNTFLRSYKLWMMEVKPCSPWRDRTSKVWSGSANRYRV